MRVPEIIPVQGEQSVATVKAVVVHAMQQMAGVQDWRARLWLAAKALEWLHANAPAFVGAGSYGVAEQRRAFCRVWRDAGTYLAPGTVDVLRQYQAELAPVRGAATSLGKPKRVAHDQVRSRIREALDLFHQRRGDSAWRALLVAHVYDVLTANPDHYTAMGAHFASVVVSKWREVGGEWPQFMSAYPVRVMPGYTDTPAVN